jgi:2-haloalkanoic acid dehalogenase type II
MPRIIVFDVNETLLDVRALEPLFRRVFGDETALREWFSLLLLHSQVATLAGPYFDFATLAKAALQMTAASRQVTVAEADMVAILNGMLTLPAHAEVPAALEMLQQAALRLVTLTNSTQRAVDEQMSNAGIAKYFERNFSVDTIKRYKPAPEPPHIPPNRRNRWTGDFLPRGRRPENADRFAVARVPHFFPHVPKPDPLAFGPLSSGSSGLSRFWRQLDAVAGRIRIHVRQSRRGC